MDIKYIYIIGVEGCGHHALYPALDIALRNSVSERYREAHIETLWQPLRNAFDQLWYSKKQTPESIEQQRQEVRNLFEGLREDATKTGRMHVLLEGNSFPSGGNRCVSMQWDVPEMTELIQPYADIHYLVLHRDPAAMTFSHPEHDGGIIEHGKLVAAFLEYINNRLLQIDPQLFKVLHYEDMVHDPQKVIQPLANFLELSPQDVELGFGHIKKRAKDWRTQMPENYQAWVKTFFTDKRRSLWPVFHAQEFSLYPQ